MCDGYDRHSFDAFCKPIFAGHRPLPDRNSDHHANGHPASYLDPDVHAISAAFPHDRADQPPHRDADTLADVSPYAVSYDNRYRATRFP